MATRVSIIQRFIGTAAEMAALDTSGLKAGSTFFDTGSGLLYVLDGAGDWHLKQGSSVSGGYSDLRGLAGDRPAFGDVEVGTTYWSVDTGDVEVSTGAAWEVV